MCERNFSKALVLFLVTCVIGCGEKPALLPVAGKVLIDGEPLTSGSIQFVPADGRPYASTIGTDGSFRLAQSSTSEDSVRYGITKGTYKIGISSTKVIDEDQDEVQRNIPGHYGDFRRSELEVDITEPLEDMVIELTWEGFEEPEETTEEALEATAVETANQVGDQEKEAAK